MSNREQAIENLKYLSSITRYNTERRAPLRKAADQLLNTEEFYSDSLNKSKVKPYLERQRPENDANRSLLDTLILTWPDDPHSQHYQFYLNLRYQDLSPVMRSEFGFSAVDMVSVEAMIFNLLSERAEALGIEADYHQFESKEEFVNIDDYSEPSADFNDKWSACVQFSRSDLISRFLTDTETSADAFALDTRYEVADMILDYLSSPLDKSLIGASYEFFKTPLFSLDESSSHLIAPFPRLLVNTAPVRIEGLFEKSEKARNAEEDKKGDIVETLVTEAFTHFDSRNYIHEWRFNDPHPRESDGLLIFDNSYWVIEVKSHPVFRKIPQNPDLAIKRIVERVNSALKQGYHALNYIEEEGSDLMFNLSGNKNINELDRGIIVVLDGFLPTLFSQNRKADEFVGFSEVYEEVVEDDRVYLITLFDLFEIGNQDEFRKLEEFLLWRTGYDFDMPIVAYNERDYWAMYFDNIVDNPEFKAVLDEVTQNENVVPYISNRFNDKPYLPDDGF